MDGAVKRYGLPAEHREFFSAVAEQCMGVDPRPFAGTDERGEYLDLTGAKYLAAVLVAAQERRRATEPEGA